LQREAIFASRVTSQLGSVIPATPSHQILQVIQAKILLTSYLFRIGHFPAARHEANSASSLAVACGLHKIRTAQPMPAFTSFIDQIDLSLQEPRDQIEEGERINAFWSVFVFDRCLSVVFGPPLVISDMDAPGMHIDTPWPLEMETYERVRAKLFLPPYLFEPLMSYHFQGQILPNLRTSGTVRSFFSGMNNGWPWANHNPLTQLSKAAALFERAARLAATWRPGALVLPFRKIPLLIDGLEEIQNYGSFYSDFVAVDQRIDEFKSQLAPLERVSGPSVPLVHLAYCLSNGATIQLHATFSSQNTGSRAKCLSAAMSIVRANQVGHVQEYTLTIPILGVGLRTLVRISDADTASFLQSLWAASGRVIVNEIVARRSFHAQAEPTSPQQRDTELRNALEQIQSVMVAHASQCALMSLSYFFKSCLVCLSRPFSTDYFLGRLQQESAGI
jgi:hypothetical protein